MGLFGGGGGGGGGGNGFVDDSPYLRLDPDHQFIAQEDPGDGTELTMEMDFGTFIVAADDGSGHASSINQDGNDISINTPKANIDVDSGGNGIVSLAADGSITFSLPNAIDTNRYIFVGGWGLLPPVLSADPAGGQLVQGLLWFNEADVKLRLYDGVSIIDLN